MPGYFASALSSFVLVEAEQLGALRGGDRGGARFSGQHAHFAEEIPFAEVRQVDRAFRPLPRV